MNVLVALAWPNHIHHPRALRWFERVHGDGWASCPATESGFVRVSSNARVIPDARTPSQAIAFLRRMREVTGHVFWPDDVSPTDADCDAFAHVLGHRQVTDAWLVSLARRRGGVLATFDRAIRDLVPSETGSVEPIP